MKRFLKIFALLSLSALLGLPSQETAMAKPYDSIAELKAYPEQAQQLPYRKRVAVYKDLSIDPRLGMTLNVLPFGIGSFQQGDFNGGMTIALLDSVALALLIWGDKQTAYPWLLSLPLYTAGRMVGITSPIRHAYQENIDMSYLLDIEHPEHVFFEWKPLNFQLSF